MKRRIRKRWLILAAIVGACLALSRCDAVRGVIESLRKPAKPFADTPAPPPPDYARASSWLALPGRNGIERSVPQGFAAVDERSAPADVFFIHPTMYLKNDVWNAPYDVAGAYNAPVLLGQVSVFNGCCRMYAPHYRQASLHGLTSQPAVALAYSDVARAFRYYIAHLNHGRPFIIASHSQGTGHAVRLLQQEVLGTPLKDRLIAAYTIGAYTPSSFATIGLPTCADAVQTGCIVSWNTSQTGRTGASILTKAKAYWWHGVVRDSGSIPAICVNPLAWTESGAVRSTDNPGSLPFPRAPFPRAATTLPPLIPHTTGAVCKDQLLDVDLPWTSDFRDTLTLLYGSYHRNDYGLFYASIRANAAQRVARWRVRHSFTQPRASLERYLIDRQTFRKRRSTVLAEWQLLAS